MVYKMDHVETIEVDQIIHNLPVIVRLNGEKFFLNKTATLTIRENNINEISISDEGVLIDLKNPAVCTVSEYNIDCKKEEK